MENPIDRIFQEFKQRNKNNNINMGGGVPTPLIDNEYELNNNVRACNNCGSLNVSIDLSSNITICNECKNKSDKPNKINFMKQMTDMQEEEQNFKEDAIKKGIQFGK